ncbi:MAG: ECF-type sigma factor [Blastocatellales bacterium]
MLTDDKPQPAEASQITHWLKEWKGGNQEARELFIAAIYQELRKLAHHYLNGERKNHTLQTDALINEAFLRLGEPHQLRAENRTQFLALTAEIMRHVLVDWARQRCYQKHAGVKQQIALNDALSIAVERSWEIVALDDALRSLAQFDPRLSRLVELKYFAGCENAELAEILGVSVATVKREWQTAKSWLYGELNH